MIKRFIIAIVALVLVCGGLVGFNLFRSKAISDFFANMQPPTQTVSTVEVKPVVWNPAIEAVGTVSAAQGIEVATEVSGIILEIKFKANDRVEQGQLLVQIDDRMERADIAAAEAQLANEQQTLDRARALSQRGVNPASTLDAAQAAVKASQAQLDRLHAVLDQKAIEAPFAGTVGIPRIETGQYISVGTVIATLQDLTRMRVDFTVPEQSFNELKIGQPVRVTDALSSEVYEGQITGIDPRIDPATRLISVRAEISNPEGALQPGQFARVAVSLPAEDGVLSLPQTAIVTSLYGDYVFAVAPKAPAENAPAPAEGEQPTFEARQLFVKTGRRTGAFVEITQGIEAGQQIVTAGQNRLSNGTPVTVDNTVDPATLAQEEAEGP